MRRVLKPLRCVDRRTLLAQRQPSFGIDTTVWKLRNTRGQHDVSCGRQLAGQQSGFPGFMLLQFILGSSLNNTVTL